MSLAAPVTASAQGPSAPARPRNLPDIPPVQLTLSADSGLELVETRHSAPTLTADPETPRPKRVRPPRAVLAEEPLQMVETRDEAQDKPAA